LDADGKEIDVFAVEGTDPTIPHEIRKAHLQESVQRTDSERREVAYALLGSLMVSGIEAGIQYEDIKRLSSYAKTAKGQDPAFLRKIIVELMLCLRP